MKKQLWNNEIDNCSILKKQILIKMEYRYLVVIYGWLCLINPWPICLKFWLGELGRITGMFLAWNSKLSGSTCIGKTPGKAEFLSY